MCLTFKHLLLIICVVILLQKSIPEIYTYNAHNLTIRAAPYFMPFDNNPQPIEEIIKKSGIKHLILAFVLATNHGECKPVWDGQISQSVEKDTHVLNIVKHIRSSGGDIAVSFGGYNGIELGHACKSAKELAAAYQLVIDKYNLINVDFDIEGDNLGRSDEESRRFKAINILRKNAAVKGRKLFVTLTLPVTMVGLSELGKAEIQRAIDSHCEIDLYKIMAFDYGGTAEHQTESVLDIIERVHTQLKSIRIDLTGEQVYSKTGLILMNGHTDQATENYSQKVFQDMVKYAKKKKLGRISFWALNRDRQCTKQVGWVAGFCSSVKQLPYEFSQIISHFNNFNHSDQVTMVTSSIIKTTRAIRATEVTKSQNHNNNPNNPPTSSPIEHDEIDCKSESNGFHRYNNDCHLYIHCYEGKVHLEECPPGTFYDTELNVCNYKEAVKRPECKAKESVKI